MTDHRALTDAEGILVSDNQNSLSAGPRGQLLMQDFHLLDKLAHFNQEWIPERAVHAKEWHYNVPGTCSAACRRLMSCYSVCSMFSVKREATR